MKRHASAVWMGGLKEGKGTVSTETGVLNGTAYSFGSRFESGAGTNPEELVVAAHAGCFSMALSAILGENGLTADRIETRATLTMEKLAVGWTVSEIHLDVAARVPNATAAAFSEAALKAETGCPISRLLKCRVTMDARLLQEHAAD